MKNICRFVPGNQTPDVIRTLHFVYETQKTGEGQLKTATVARVYLVTEGHAAVMSSGVRKAVGPGDLFFILPSVAYVIEGDESFKYMYISFLGLRGSVILERLNINARNFYFPDFQALEPLWRQGIAMSNEFSDLISESVLLHTFAAIGQRTAENRENEVAAGADRFLLIKRHIDDHFSSPALSLESIAREFSYNKKYLSTAFKKYFKMGVTEYINAVRINHACVLIGENYTGVSDIAFLCGFKDAMYFSKVFKRITGQSPKDFIHQKNHR
ncbi:MAG: helix-turn-helix transcriptional regulator [Clostridia bacterium]|nr:helix-turn-helix transcriptional regulator [Clostridia bacterium]